jgi:two-component system, sporulation sensor kinase E
VQILTAFQADCPELLIDEKLIKQAILNVIQNALSAMPNGGSLSLSTTVVGDMVNLSVADTGTGIPDEIMDKIFEPYFTTKEFGSGLGLTLVFKIVKEHNAEIVVQSRPGKGTTFTISFPVPQTDQRLLYYAGEGQ